MVTGEPCQQATSPTAPLGVSIPFNDLRGFLVTMALPLTFPAGAILSYLFFGGIVLGTNWCDVAAEPMQLAVNGQQRTFLLERPATKGPHPTVIMLHGGGSGAEQEMRLSGLAELGPREGFVAVFPEGKGKLWNFFPPGTENHKYRLFLEHLGGLPDDVAFIRTLVSDLVQGGLSDSDRIYLAGRSLGGAMTLRLACVDAGSFAAIGLLVAAMPVVTASDCYPQRAVPMLAINGTKDHILPYRGERTGGFDLLWSTRRLVVFFRELNGCEESAGQPARVDNPEVHVVIQTWTNCSAGPVVLYTVVDGGHEVPNVLNATQKLLDFFRDRRR
jgi:polyhydroxybutyrate depolymerase